MRRGYFIKTLIAVMMLTGSALAQTQTYTGTIKDLTGTPVTSGRISFTLTPAVDTTVPGTGRFTPTTVSCLINATGNPVSSDGTSACTVATNTSLNPTGTSYRVCIQPQFSTPGSCFYDYALGGSKDISTIAPTLQTGPVSYAIAQGPVGPPGCVIGSTCTTALNPQSLNGVLNPALFTGSDIGAKINAAFASQPNSSAVLLKLPPNTNYTLSTQIVIPGNWTSPFVDHPVLDCQGSALTWTGTGDMISVLSENSNGPSGAIRNCFILNATGNTAGINGVHQLSRGGFEYTNNYWAGWTNASSSALFVENSPFAQFVQPAPGYNERLLIDHNVFTYNTKDVRLLGSNGGTTSFARLQMVNSFCNANGTQTCLAIEGNGIGADVYDSKIDLRGNVDGGSTASVIKLSGSADLRSGSLMLGLEGPPTSFLINIADSISNVFMPNGVISGNGMSFRNLNTSDALILPSSPNSYVHQAVGFQNQFDQSTNSKVIYDGANWRFGSVGGGGGNQGAFQIFGRNTTNCGGTSGNVCTGTLSPEVDATTDTVYPQYNLLFTSAYCKGVGIGPGFGLSSPCPAYSLQVSGTMGLTSTAGVNGTVFSSSVDTSGNLTQYYLSGSLAGQPSNHWRTKFYDYVTSADIAGQDCNASNGKVLCSLNGTYSPTLLKIGTSAPPTCAAAADGGTINYIAGSPGAKDIVQVCAKDAANNFAWRTIY